MDKETRTLRQNGIGGSDIAKIVGMSSYGGPLDVYVSKAEPIGDEEFREAAAFGTNAEDAVVQTWLQKRAHEGKPPIECRKATTVFDGILMANVDRMLRIDGEEIVGEVKTASINVKHRWGKTGTDEIPAEYRCQVEWYMGILKLKRSIVIVETDHKITEYEVKADPMFFKWLVAEANIFWREHVERRIPPAFDGGEAGDSILFERHGSHKDDAREALPADLPVVWELTQVLREAKALDVRKGALVQQMKDKIGKLAGIYGDFGKVSWKTNKNGSRVFRPTINEHWNYEEPVNVGDKPEF